MPHKVPPPIEEDRGYKTPCLIDQGRPNGSGYPGVRHRRAFEAEFGPLEKGYEIDHLCHVRMCVRAGHMEAVTHAENMRRMNELRTTCPQGHPYDEIRKDRGHRDCSTCRRRQAREGTARYLAKKRMQ